jgi:hypothetical protein
VSKGSYEERGGRGLSRGRSLSGTVLPRPSLLCRLLRPSRCLSPEVRACPGEARGAEASSSPSLIDLVEPISLLPGQF